jgi:hypothetical protein
MLGVKESPRCQKTSRGQEGRSNPAGTFLWTHLLICEAMDFCEVFTVPYFVLATFKIYRKQESQLLLLANELDIFPKT